MVVAVEKSADDESRGVHVRHTEGFPGHSFLVPTIQLASRVRSESRFCTGAGYSFTQRPVDSSRLFSSRQHFCLLSPYLTPDMCSTTSSRLR